MIKIVVRSKKDRNAVEAALRIFYPDWDIEVLTLKGARSYESMLSELKSLVTDDSFYIVLLGREDEDKALHLEKDLPPNVTVHVVPRARVRNTRIEHLAHEIDVARAKIRLTVSWIDEDKCYVLDRRGTKLENLDYDPAYDMFLAIGKGFISRLSEVLGYDLSTTPLLVRRYGGEHLVYIGKHIVGRLYIPDEGVEPRGELLMKPSEHVDLSKTIELSKPIIKMFENIALKLLSRFRDFDTIIIPISGGKDSTAVLNIALKVFDRSNIYAVYVDTGVEFPYTMQYIEYLEKRFGIEVIKEYAGIDRALAQGKPLPDHNNRWCTGLKLEATARAIAKLSRGRTLLILGDRDAESERRARRPFIRTENGITIVAPLKLWSTLHVQLYLLSEGIELNPLYEKGFYRIGCYICPALRSWELYVILHDEDLLSMLEQKPFFKQFLRRRSAKACDHH